MMTKEEFYQLFDAFFHEQKKPYKIKKEYKKPQKEKGFFYVRLNCNHNLSCCGNDGHSKRGLPSLTREKLFENANGAIMYHDHLYKSVLNVIFSFQDNNKDTMNTSQPKIKTKEEKLADYRKKLELGEEGENKALCHVHRIWNSENCDIEQVSKTKGDCVGYDICVKDKNNGRIIARIEVKSTDEDSDTPFFFTEHEKKQLDEKDIENNGEYFVFRIYALDTEKTSGFLTIIKRKELLDPKKYVFTPEPTNFRVSLLTNKIKR